jgi:uncharacterized protein YyaL (SSP411 family)
MRTHGPRPSYQVVSTLLLVLAVLGIGFKILSRYLPEVQQNRAAAEYSTLLRVVGRQQISWYPYSQEAFDRAKELDRLIYMEVGSILSRYSNIVADRFYNNDEFRSLLRSHFIAIRVDTAELPAVALALAMNTPIFVESEGVLFVVLTPEGYPVEATRYRQLTSPREPLGMYEWLSAHARSWVSDKEAVRAKAKSRIIDQRKTLEEQFQVGPVSQDLAESYTMQIAAAFDVGSGRIGERNAPLSASIPWLLSIQKRAASAGSNWVAAIRRGPTYDQFRGGVFDDSQSGWWNPSYAKRSSRAAEFAALFAAHSKGDDLLRQGSLQTVEWLQNSMLNLQQNLFAFGLSTDELVLDGSKYYDLSASEVAGTVFRIAGSKSLGRTYLPISASASDSAALSREVNKVLPLFENRSVPMTDDGIYTDENARTISGLAIAGIFLDEPDVITSAALRLRRLLSDRVRGLGDVEHAPAGRAQTTGFSGDYVWIVRALIDVYRATADTALLDMAVRVTTRTKELFMDDDGLLFARLGSERMAAFELPIKPICDDYNDSINSVWIRNLQDLAALTGNREYMAMAFTALQSSSIAATRLGVRGAGLMRAMFEHSRAAILISAPDPLPFSMALQRRHVGHLAAPNPTESDEIGYYWIEGGSKTGPFTLAEIESRLAMSRAQ